MTANHSCRLHGRTALVSGGLRGIGRAIVHSLVEDGANVLATDLDSDADGAHALADIQGDISYLRMDATSETDWKAAAAHVQERWGRLDILVNNVGGDLSATVRDMRLEQWRSIMAVNVESVFLGTRTFQDLLALSGASTPAGSSIVNISSVMGIVGMGGVSAYSATKGAVRLFSRSSALEFADANMRIRVNSVFPGFVSTPLMRNSLEHSARRSGQITADEIAAGLSNQVPLKRMADPMVRWCRKFGQGAKLIPT